MTYIFNGLQTKKEGCYSQIRISPCSEENIKLLESKYRSIYQNEARGIVPLNPQAVLEKLPNYLQENRDTTGPYVLQNI